MKRNKISKKIVYSVLSLGFLGSTGLALSNVTKTSDNFYSQKVSSSLNANDVASPKVANGSSVNIPPLNQTSNGDVDFSTPRQYSAFNSDNTKYAILNSSDTSTTSGTSSSFDQMTLYDMSNGSVKWTKKVSDLNDTAIVTKTNLTSGKFLAITYLQGFGSRKDMILTLVSANSKLYLTGLDLSNGNQNFIFEIQNSAVNKQTSQSNTQYFVFVNNFIDANIQIVKIDYSSTQQVPSTQPSLKLSFANIVGINHQRAINFTETTISNNIMSTMFQSKDYVVSSYYRDSYNNYFVFQQNIKNNINSQAHDNFAILLKVGKNQTANDITTSNFMSLSITAEQAKLFSNSNKPLVVNIQQYNENENFIIFSQDESGISKNDSNSQNKQTYLIGKYSNNNFGNSTSINFSSIESQYDGNIVSMTPLYSNQGDISGFLALNNKNKALRFSNDFTTVQLYHDLSKVGGTSTNGNKFYNIFTRFGDPNWYAQESNGEFYQFSAANYIGKLSDSSTSRDEIIAGFTFKEQEKVPTSITFKNVNDTNFDSYISTYAKEFLNIESFDPVFGDPIISAKNITKEKIGDTNNYYVTIGFYQTLRNTGRVNGTNDVLLGYQTYIFTNSPSTVSIKDKSQIPTSITQKKPSDVTKDEVEQILNISNCGDYELGLQPNDAFGTLTVNITSKYVWIAGELKVDYRQSITIGSPESPYFMIDLLNGLSSNVEFVTDKYLDNHAELKSALQIRYGTMLPSEVSATQILSDFVILGDAFFDGRLINQGIITPPSAENVQLTPADNEGYLYVTVTIPKVGEKRNLTYSFKTAEIFRKSATASQNAFIIFKDNETVLDQEIVVSNQTYKLQSYLPSNISSQLQTEKTWLLYFANISNYILNMIYTEDPNPDASLYVNANDGLGQLTVGIKFNKPVDGLNGNIFEKTFTGFTSQGATGQPAPNNFPTFQWGKIDNNAFNGKTPSDITVATIEGLSSSLFEGNGTTNSLKRDIIVTPLNASAAVLVEVTYYNWWEERQIEGENRAILLPKKSFTTILTNGLRSAKESINTIVWKSFDELDANITSSTANNAIATISASAATDLEKLKQVANVSQALEKELSKEESNLAISITANNALGYIEIFARFDINGEAQSFGTKISGFSLESSNYIVTLANTTDKKVDELKTKLPSELTDEEIGSLINVQLGNNLTKKITTNFDDLKGTLTVTIQLFDTSTGIAVEATPAVTRTYYGFKTNVPEYKGTNYVIVSVSIVLPIVILLTPILYIVLYKNKKDIKKFSKVLDKRLSQHNKRKKVVDVNKIEDLLLIEKD